MSSLSDDLIRKAERLVESIKLSGPETEHEEMFVAVIDAMHGMEREAMDRGRRITAPRERAYISGPITGIPDDNRAAFCNAKARLLAMGFDPVSPLDLPHEPGSDWFACMRLDLVEMLKADAVYALSGWKESRGALIEVRLAASLGIPVIFEGTVTGANA